jgi:hypothetical protein
MPRVCEFYGITIYLYFNDHAPPHFHAFYGGSEALIEIETLRLLRGALPPRAYGLVVEWAAQRREELRRAWAQAVTPAPIDPIAPLT